MIQVAFSIFNFSTFYLTDPIFIGIVLFWPSDYFILLCSLSDESEQEEEKERPLTREEEDIDIIRSWVEVGGHPAQQEGEAKELLLEVKHIPMSLSSINLFVTNSPHHL